MQNDKSTGSPKNEGLPELPASFGDHCVTDSVRTMRESGYTAGQMRDYGRTCYEAALAREASRDGSMRQPDGYHYRYPDTFGEGTVIRATNGREVNGSKPIEAIPYWYAPQPEPVVSEEAEQWGVGSHESARRLFDTALRNRGLHEDAYHVGCGAELDLHDQAAIDAISDALMHAQPPRHDRGDVEQRARELLSRHAPMDMGVVTINQAIRAITAALSEAKPQELEDVAWQGRARLGNVHGNWHTIGDDTFNYFRQNPSADYEVRVLYTAPQVEAKPKCPACACDTESYCCNCGWESVAKRQAGEGVPVQVGERLFQFDSMQDWVNHASRIWRKHGVASDNTVCVDALGRIVGWGKHFKDAERDGAYPITVYRLRSDMNNIATKTSGEGE